MDWTADTYTVENRNQATTARIEIKAFQSVLEQSLARVKAADEQHDGLVALLTPAIQIREMAITEFEHSREEGEGP